MYPSIVTGCVITGKGLASVICPGLGDRVEARNRNVLVPGRRGRDFEHDVVDARVGVAIRGHDCVAKSARPRIAGIGHDEGQWFVVVLLVIVNVAKAIEPRVAPPPGWLKARLTVEKVVGRLELARIGIEKVSSV